MKRRRKLRIAWIWLLTSSTHIILIVLARLELFNGTLLEGLGITALLVPYGLHWLGLPVLMNDGLTGWGWAAPNSFGWFLSVVAWLSLHLLIAIGLERLTSGSR